MQFNARPFHADDTRLGSFMVLLGVVTGMDGHASTLQGETVGRFAVNSRFTSAWSDDQEGSGGGFACRLVANISLSCRGSAQSSSMKPN